MPYQLIVHWSDTKSEVMVTGTRGEVAAAMSDVAAKVTSKKARWETKYVPAVAVVTPTLLSSQLGVNGNATRSTLDAK